MVTLDAGRASAGGHLKIDAVSLAAVTHLRRQFIRLPVGHQVENGEVLAANLTLDESADVKGIRVVFAEVRCTAGHMSRRWTMSGHFRR